MEKSIVLSYKLHISYMGGGGNVNIIKVFIILFLLEGIGNILAISKINQQTLLSIESPGIFFSCPN